MIDEIDIEILNILQEKARIPNVEVERRVGMAPSAVLERIRKLERQGVIDGYEVRLNPQRFHKDLVAFVTVTIAHLGEEIRFGKTFARIPEIQEVHYIAGKDAFLLKVRVSDPEALGGFLREAIAKIDGIRSISSAVVLSTYKETARIPVEKIQPVR